MATVKLLTFIGSLVPGMPGHSAIAIDGTVYSFEDMMPSVITAVARGVVSGIPGGPMLSNKIPSFGTGWKVINLNNYVLDNSYRPIIFQDITKSINHVKLTAYVKGSASEGALYGNNGVCSTQTGYAINASLYTGKFDPDGLNTPRAVYAEVDARSIASSTSVTWANPSQKGPAFMAKIVGMAKADYPKIYAMDSFPKSQGV